MRIGLAESEWGRQARRALLFTLGVAGYGAGLGLSHPLPELPPSHKKSETSKSSKPSELLDTLDLPPTLITASRTSRASAEAVMPVSVVTGVEMRRSAASTLSDVLAEQTGLTVTQNHGTGVQMQGLDPDYTLILVDGEPAVGRTAGTMELDRFLVGGLEQVEIVKGPSSSLYGSDALGGTINLVTRRPRQPLGASLFSRWGANPDGAMQQTGGHLEARHGPLAFSLFADRLASAGYDLTPETRSLTAPRYQGYSLQPKLIYAYGDSSRLTLSARQYLENQANQDVYTLLADTLKTHNRERLLDRGLSAALEQYLSPHLDLTVKGYATTYQTQSKARIDSSGWLHDDSLVTQSTFEQSQYKGESALRARFAGAGKHTLLAGGGGAFEIVRADRVQGGKRSASSGFVFLQDEWEPSAWARLQASGRIDAHSDYAGHFSPRLAGLVQPYEWLAFRASVGKGFKAPTFQELYLDFTNASVGYSVFGATGAAEALGNLEAQGLIEERLLDLPQGDLQPENAWSFNAGVEASFGAQRPAGRKLLSAKVNFFHNQVSDLIDSRAVARKTNGQQVYTYFNIDRIHTQGVESDAVYRPWSWLTLAGGYQFLIARDDDVMRRIENGEIAKVGATGVVRPVQMSEYGGLLGRSRHAGNVKATWQQALGDHAEASVSLRGLLRGRFGQADRNGNGILDDQSEYEAGYTLWNVSASLTLYRFLSLETRVDNALDEVRPLVPLPGRLIYAGFRLESF